MKKQQWNFVQKLFLLTLFGSSFLFGQISMTVNSLADDQDAYPWDDPATPVDESRDGICQDGQGRCTLRAAIEESINMAKPANIDFNISGTINLFDALYPYDGTSIYGGKTVELKGLNCFFIDNNCQIAGFKFNATYSAITVTGNHNVIGEHNVFLNSYTAVEIDGDSNYVGACYVGVDTDDVVGSNTIGISILGNYNTLSQNTVCGNSTGVYIAEGGNNELRANFIGISTYSDTGLGNIQGITIIGSNNNLIGGTSALDGNIICGNGVAGIEVSGAPPDKSSVDNYIWYNFIGVGPDGPVPNGRGIVITNGAKYESILKNIIAGNTFDGIYIFGYDDQSLTSDHLISDNQIGIEGQTLYPNGGNGISIWGNVKNVIIGTNAAGLSSHLPNVIVGNKGKGISVLSDSIYFPSKITMRKNLIYQNGVGNIMVSQSSNEGVQPPYSLSFSNHTIAGIHDVPGAIIDIYKSNFSEAHPSAHAWLGSTTVGANGVFAYAVTDPTIAEVSLTATTGTGNTSEFTFIDLITNVDKKNTQVPARFSLHQNYPNPFNPTTTIAYEIPSPGFVSLKVYDALGREAAALVNETKEAGYYSAPFDASQLSSGIYFAKLQSGDKVDLKKMVLMK